MNEIIVLLILLLTALFGYSLINYFKILKKESLGFRFFLGFALLFGVIGSQLFIYSLLGISWNRLSLISPYIFLVPLVIKSILNFKLRVSKDIFNNKVKLILLILIVGLIFFTFFESIIRPLSSWDAWSSWQMKSKMYFDEGGVRTSGFFYLQSEYPVVVSLFYTFIYTMLGKIDDTAIQLVSAFFYLGTGVIIYSFLKKRTTITYSLLFTFLLLSTQNLIRHGGRYEAGIADIIVGFYILISVILFYLFKEKSSSGLISFFFIILAILSQIKNEGSAMAVILFFLSAGFLVFTKKHKQLLYALIFLLPFAGWSLYKYTNHLPVNIIARNPRLDVLLVLKIMSVETREYFNIQNWNLGWIIFFVSFIVAFFQKRKYIVIFLPILLQLLFYVLIFLFSGDPVEHSRGIYDRLLIHIYPSAVLVTAFVIYNFTKDNTLISG